MAQKILVLCTGNSCRSQIAEGYLRYFAGNKAEIYSAGIETHGVNPMAIETMKEDRIDISNHTSNNVSEYQQIDFDYVITVCDNTNEHCPYFPTKALKIHQNFPDPAKAQGTDTEIKNEFCRVRNMIKDFCRQFIDNQIIWKAPINIDRNFYLNTQDWDYDNIQEIINLLDNVINLFYQHLDAELIPKVPVCVYHTQNDYAEYLKKSGAINLSKAAKGNQWYVYVYEFSHELCHHVIYRDPANHKSKNDRFGWFEEAICDLARIYCLDRISQTWKVNPPNSGWEIHSAYFANKVKELLNYTNNLSKNELYEILGGDRYQRELYKIFVIQLFPLFKNNPESWKSIQYLKSLKITSEMTFDNFIHDWTELVPNELTESLNKIKTILK